MRFNKTVLLFSLVVLATVPLLEQPLQAKSVATTVTGGVSATRSSQSTMPSSDYKNEGRKLSMTVPGLGTAVVTVTPAEPKPLLGKPLAPGRHLRLGQTAEDRDRAQKHGVSIEADGNNITLRVPPSIDAAIEDAQVVTKQLGNSASKGISGVNKFAEMVVLYLRQLTGTSTITPAGYPYTDKSPYIHSFGPLSTGPIASGHKLYFTGEGRLKSVVTH